MTTMKNCILCFHEIEEEYLPCYPPKLPELFCKYLHSSLTQETLLGKFNHDNDLSFCPKCFISAVELGDLNDQLELYQKRISELVFILSLEILHRRGNLDSNCDQNRPNYGNWERNLIEFDVSALPHCDFKKDTAVITDEIEKSAENCHNFNSGCIYEDLDDPLVIRSAASSNANTVDVTFEKIKVDIDTHSWIDEEYHEEINANENNETNFCNNETTKQTASAGQIGNKRLIPMLKLQKLNFLGNEQKVIVIESHQDKKCSNESAGLKSQIVCTKNDFGGSYKITASKNCSEDLPQILCITTVNSISKSSSSQQVSGENDSADIMKESKTNPFKQNNHLNQSTNKPLQTGQDLNVHGVVSPEKQTNNCDVGKKQFKAKDCSLKEGIVHTGNPAICEKRG